jgi:predicted DCC family thiol-disulfide oxidoreductase YuxK
MLYLKLNTFITNDSLCVWTGLGEPDDPMGEWRFKLLYDGECPLCVREVKWLQRWNRRGHLAFEDISADGFDPAHYATTREELMQAMHGVFPDGRMVSAVEAFREAYSLVGLGWLLAPTRWPVLRPIFDASYRVFARYRMPLGSLFGRSCDSGACHVPSKTLR